MNIPDALQSLPVGVLIGLAVLIVLQVVLDVIALTDLVKRPAEQLVIRNKWIWAAIIVFVNTIGAILYLAVGRKRSVVAVETRPTAAPGDRAADAADVLYGVRKDADRR
jgi:hypothetical protein